MLFKSVFLSHSIRLFKQTRNASILSSLETSPVLVSANKDVYTNLALEHWLYNNLKFSAEHKVSGSDARVFDQPVVLLWTDEPCVVMGRHQNPWIESTLGFINRAGMKLARRHSGGGCVYHDENNINISIIGDRKLFEKRQDNLRFLAKVIDDNYGVKLESTKRHDLVHVESGRKISGSAAKLGRFNSYHHFTLLVDTDSEVMSTAIRQKQQDFIQSNSSLSTRSKVINLKELKADITVEQVINDLTNAYIELYGKPDTEQPAEKSVRVGDEADYLDLKKYKEELESWDWVYGLTPRFTLERSFDVLVAGEKKQVKFDVRVNKGIFENINVTSDLTNQDVSDRFRYLIGTKFTYQDAMVNIARLLQVDEPEATGADVSIGLERVFATFLLQMVHESNY